MARAAEQLRRLAPLIWLSALPALGYAQAEPTPIASSPDPSAATAPAPPTVLFLLPTDTGEGVALRDALLAQFALVDAQLVFEADTPDTKSSLSSRLSLAQELAMRRNAVAVFWIDASPNGRWLLHMMDAQNERVIVRAVNAGGERRSAAIEAVAVMTRSSTRALIEDQLDLDRTAAPPTPDARDARSLEPSRAASAQDGRAPASASGSTSESAPTPVPSSAPPADFRLSVGYTGDHFARQVDWQHGIAFGISFLGFQPLYAGIGFALTPAIEVSSEAVTFSLRRLPFSGRFGYRIVGERIALDAELGLMLEWLHRSPSVRHLVMGSDVTERDATDGLIAAVAPRLRAELRVLPAVGLYAGGGLDILLNNFAYISNGTQVRELLHPNRFRPVAELGISFYP